jgi:hypothetical protein
MSQLPDRSRARSAAAVVLVSVAIGLLAMRRDVFPLASALVTPRSGAVARLFMGAPPIPDIAPESRRDEQAPGWVVLGWTTARDSARIASSVSAQAEVLVRCTVAGLAADDESDEPPEIDLCVLQRLTLPGLKRCEPYTGERLTLLRFFQTTSQRSELEPAALGQTCRDEATQWRDWNPLPSKGARRP